MGLNLLHNFHHLYAHVRITGLLANRPLAFLGTISCSLYLWHYPVLDRLAGYAKAHGNSTTNWHWATLAVAVNVAAMKKKPGTDMAACGIHSKPLALFPFGGWLADSGQSLDQG